MNFKNCIYFYLNKNVEKLFYTKTEIRYFKEKVICRNIMI